MVIFRVQRPAHSLIRPLSRRRGPLPPFTPSRAGIALDELCHQSRHQLNHRPRYLPGPWVLPVGRSTQSSATPRVSDVGEIPEATPLKRSVPLSGGDLVAPAFFATEATTRGDTFPPANPLC